MRPSVLGPEEASPLPQVVPELLHALPPLELLNLQASLLQIPAPLLARESILVELCVDGCKASLNILLGFQALHGAQRRLLRLRPSRPLLRPHR
jgi:hypothetical protein